MPCRHHRLLAPNLGRVDFSCSEPQRVEIVPETTGAPRSALAHTWWTEEQSFTSHSHWPRGSPILSTERRHPGNRESAPPPSCSVRTPGGPSLGPPSPWVPCARAGPGAICSFWSWKTHEQGRRTPGQHLWHVPFMPGPGLLLGSGAPPRVSRGAGRGPGDVQG